MVVPVETASNKHEFAARTLRPKLNRLWDTFIEDLKPRPVKHKADTLGLKSEIDVSDPDAVLTEMSLDREVGPVKRFAGARARRASG